MANMKFIVDPSGKAERFMQAAIDSLKDFREPLQETSDFQLKTVDQQFTTRGTKILGRRWVKRKRKYKHPILEKTKKMRRSFGQTMLTKNRLEITSRGVDYYKYHQKGTNKLPRRQMVGHSKKMIERVLRIFSKYIIKQAKRG